jgi:quercetin dioxygenase-like cupin family protein
VKDSLDAYPLSKRANSLRLMGGIEGSVAKRAGTPDWVGTVGALLMGPDGGCITGRDLLMDGGVAASCWFGAVSEVRTILKGARRMKITRSGAQASAKGPGDWFTGTVRIDPLFTAPAPARAAGAAVTFEPGARTAWHTHPLGQTLIVTFGLGRVQRDGGPVEEIRPGDVVWCEPGEKHWHGASPTTAMQHIAIQESRDGKAVEWLEQVRDEDYQRGPAAR